MDYMKMFIYVAFKSFSFFHMKYTVLTFKTYGTISTTAFRKQSILFLYNSHTFLYNLIEKS